MPATLALMCQRFPDVKPTAYNLAQTLTRKESVSAELSRVSRTVRTRHRVPYNSVNARNLTTTFWPVDEAEANGDACDTRRGSTSYDQDGNGAGAARPCPPATSPATPQLRRPRLALRGAAIGPATRVPAVVRAAALHRSTARGRWWRSESSGGTLLAERQLGRHAQDAKFVKRDENGTRWTARRTSSSSRTTRR